MTRAPSCGSYRSRTIERPQVTACGHRGALQGAPRDEPADRGGQRGQHAGHGVQRQAGKQHRAATAAVGERAAGELPHAEADDQRRQRELRRADAGAEVAGERRQRGQVQVGGDRLDAQQQREQRDDDGG
jgi:hypothetical protein